MTAAEQELENGAEVSGSSPAKKYEGPAVSEGSFSGYALGMAVRIARREVQSFFDSLIAYVVIGGSALALGVYFFLLQNGGFWQVDRATMGRLFEFLPWAFSAVVIPLVTMRAIAEEKRSGTLELLITMPLHDSSVILGKYFAALTMCVGLLAATLLYPISLFVWPWHMGTLDWGPVWTGYLGLVLFCSAGCAVGLLFSTITDSQIIAFFMTAAVLIMMQIVGSVVETSDNPLVGNVVSFVSFQSRFAPFGRGLLDTRDVVYFLSITVIALLWSFRNLESRKWS